MQARASYSSGRMSKRTVTDILSPARTEGGQAFSKVSTNGAKRETTREDERGEFEDAWEDEIESDEDVVDADGAAEEGEGASISSLYPLMRNPINARNGRR
jgi:ribosome assembly protein RRB1